MLKLKKASKNDLEDIIKTQIRSFEDDEKNKPASALKGLPPAADSITWNLERMEKDLVYTISYDEAVVGGFILFKKKYEIIIGRIWIDPDYQNRGLGQEAFSILFSKYSEIKKWYLETPDWAVRNHHFYEKLGFKLIGLTDFDDFTKWREHKYELLK